ncbi:MAG: 3-oxoadipate--succinyl-CoA transferase subunit A [Bdellovibrionaceae bacterium]|nr:3-oxoadipate--succinyl-CoA transferase subunit A [Pseudobdellovibrionaceae bacterium]
MKEAIASSLRSGDSLVIEGFTHLIGFAAGHEIIRQKIKRLKAIRLTPDLVYDQMIEAGIVSELIFSWAGNPGVGSLHAIRRRTEARYGKPKLKLDEYSHFGMLGRLMAGSAGLPFWTLRNFSGTDLPRNSNIKSVECPYTGEVLATVPAIHPDLAIIHVQKADRMGNAQVWGLMGTQKESAFAAKKVIIVAEEIVESSEIRKDPNRTLIPGVVVDFVVHEPWGAHPSYAQGYYDRDNDFYIQWDEISRDPETYQKWLNEFVYSVSDRREYMQKMGTNLMEKIKADARYCQGVNYGF